MNIRYGVSETIGWRESMEDEHAIYERPEEHLFGAEIYDGHGGKTASRIAVEMLTPYFMHNRAREMGKSLRDRRKDTDLLRDAYLAVDNHLLERHIQSGTTAAHFYIMEDRFIAANAGDTRVIIGTEGNVIVLTVDHKPTLSGETGRIEALGGEVTRIGTPRVQGVLAVSRALGDLHLKPYVIAEPRVAEGYLGKENDYAVLACDGVWDVLTPEDVIREVRQSTDPQKGADRIVKKALDHGSTDNIIVIVIDLREYTGRMRRNTMEITAVTDYGAIKAVDSR
ncbi:MAG: PP2C family serine/threonine-protein phosphatase [Syntrophorhabdaceae bacterium]|nr:PP2C family serine/threonine-protein phosphatase [Syntrophorhabdaceae bacterium]MDD5242884.1 PP2C family serine/threonine-protein phosphatase [Syntrophorhabdaceae bacterium]